MLEENGIELRNFEFAERGVTDKGTAAEVTYNAYLGTININLFRYKVRHHIRSMNLPDGAATGARDSGPYPQEDQQDAQTTRKRASLHNNPRFSGPSM